MRMIYVRIDCFQRHPAMSGYFLVHIHHFCAQMHYEYILSLRGLKGLVIYSERLPIVNVSMILCKYVSSSTKNSAKRGAIRK